MSKWLLAVVVLVALTIPSSASDKKQSGGNAEDQIKALQNQSRDAALKGDSSFLEKHLADDYSAITGNGMESNKDQQIQARKNGTMKYDSIEIRDEKIKVYGNTAVVNDDAEVKGSMNGQPISGEYKARFVWVKQAGDWKLVSFQATPVQSTAAAQK